MHTLLHYDVTGDLHSNVFFELSIPLPDWRLFFPQDARTGLWSKRNDDCVTSRVKALKKEVISCTRDPSHLVDIIYTPVGVELSNTKSEIAYFLPNFEGEEYTVCSQAFLNSAIAHDFRTAAGAGIMVPQGGLKDGRTNQAKAAHVQ